MPVPSLITDLSATAASNSPSGSEAPVEGDNHLRAAYAFIRQLYDGVTASGNAQLASLADPTSASNGDAMVAVKQPFTGAVARTQHQKNAELVTANDFYEAGVTTHAAALNAAFASGATRVYVYGAWEILADVTVPDGVDVIALRGNLITLTGGDFIFTSNTYAEGLNFDMDGGAHQVRGEGVEDVHLHKCTSTGGTNNGFYFDDGPKRLTITWCRSSLHTKAGLEVAGSQANAPEDIVVHHNWFYSNGRAGATIGGVGDRTSPASVANYAQRVSVWFNRCDDNGDSAHSGIEIVYTSKFTHGCNQCNGNFEHGISHQEVDTFAGFGDILEDNGQAGYCPQSGYANANNPVRYGTIVGMQAHGNDLGISSKEITKNITYLGGDISGNTSYSARFVDLGGSLLTSEDIAFIGVTTEPSPGAGVVNSNSSPRVSYPGQLNFEGLPIQLQKHEMISIITAVTINTKGTTETWPSLITLDNTVAVNVSRTAIAEAYDGRRITLRAYAGGTVQIQNGGGNGTTLAGFINNTGAAIVLAAGKMRCYVGNGIDFVEEGV